MESISKTIGKKGSEPDAIDLVETKLKNDK